MWLKANPKFPHFIGWSTKYGAFTKAERDFHIVKNYIKRQKVHHGRVDFVQEVKTIFKEEKIEFDEKYLFE